MATQDTTQVADLEAEAALEDADQPVGTICEFYSKSTNLLLIRVPEITQPLATGVLEVRQKGVSVSFAPGGRARAKVGQDVLPTKVGEFGEVEEEDLVSWLRNHHANGVLFFEEGREPDRPRPTEDQMLEWIVDAVAALDSSRAHELLEHEQATHNREVILRACQRALQKIEMTVAAEHAPAVSELAQAARGEEPEPSG